MTALNLSEHIYWLHQLNAEHCPHVGPEAYALGQALQAGVPVLPGAVIGGAFFTGVLEAMDWADPLFADFPQSSLYIDVENPRQLQAIAQRLQQNVQAYALGEDDRAVLRDVAQALEGPLLAVRPFLFFRSRRRNYATAASSTDDTVTPVTDIAQGLLGPSVCHRNVGSLVMALQQVWTRFFQASHLFYWQRQGVPWHRLALAAVIQPLPPAVVSGTLELDADGFTCWSTWGMGQPLTEGDLTPDRYSSSTDRRSQPLVTPTVQAGSKPYAYALQSTIVSPTASPTASPTERKGETQGHGKGAVNAVSSYALHQYTNYHTVPDAYRGRPILPESVLHQLHEWSDILRRQMLWPIRVEWQLCLRSSLDDPAGSRDAGLDGGYGFPWEQPEPEQSPPGAEPGPECEPPALMDVELYGLHISAIHTIAAIHTIDAIRISGPARPLAAPNARLTPDASMPTLDRKMDGEVDEGPSTRNGGDPPDDSGLDLGPEVDREVGHNDPKRPDCLYGVGVSGGRAIAPVVVMDQPLSVLADVSIAEPCIIVAPQMTAAWFKTMQSARGVICEQGSLTAHGAILARELNIPAVMGVPGVVAALRTGDWVMVDGDRGTVTLLDDGGVPAPIRQQPLQWEPHHSRQLSPEPMVSLSSPVVQPSLEYVNRDGTSARGDTVTAVMVSVSQPDHLESIAPDAVDGVGLIRSELMMVDVLSQRPLDEWLSGEARDRLIQVIASRVQRIAQHFGPCPLWYRTLDLRRSEYPMGASTAAGAAINPTWQHHGTYSYCLDSRLFRLELEALRRSQERGVTTLNVLLPFVRTVEEFQQCHSIMDESGVLAVGSCQVWIMAEVPSVLYLLPDYISAGVQGIAIGSNDLAHLLLGMDRTQGATPSDQVMAHPSVLRAIQSIITTARQHNIPCTLCGDLLLQQPDIVETLIRWGLSGVSVGPQAIASTRQRVADAEQRLFFDWRHV